MDCQKGELCLIIIHIKPMLPQHLPLPPFGVHQVCEVADICCDGRVVSVLEGGYGRTPPPIPPPSVVGEPPPSPPVKQKLDRSFFSECAIQHLQGLVDPYYTEDEQQQKYLSSKKCP